MITLDIEDTRIRMVVIEGKQVVKAASLPLSLGLVKDGLILSKTAVSQQLSDLLAAYDVTDKKVIANVSGMHSLYRIFSLPRLPSGMLSEAVRRQMTKVLPVSPSEIYTSWQALNISSSETMICLVGSPRNTVDALWETLRLAGLQPQLIDVNTLALARLPDEKDAIIVNVQQVGFDIVVMINGIPRLVRSLPFFSEDMAVPDKVKAIKDELDRTVLFYKSSREGDLRMSNVPVFLSGDSSGIMTGALDYPIKMLPEWFNYPEGFNPSEYAVNIGLALKQMRGIRSHSKVSLNVIPEAYLPKPRPVIEVISWVFIVVAVALLVPLAILAAQEVGKNATLQTRVSTAQVQVGEMQTNAAQLAQLQTKINNAQNSLAVFQQPLGTFEAQRTKVNGDLAKVTSLQPGAGKLKSISYSAAYTSLLVSGTAPDKTLILNYARALRDSGRFTSVLVQKMAELEFNKLEYTLELK